MKTGTKPTKHERGGAVPKKATKLTGIRVERPSQGEPSQLVGAVKKPRSLAELRGKIKFAPDYSHKAARLRG